MRTVQMVDRQERIRALELRLVEKRIELVELRTKSFGLWWREKLYNMKRKGL